MNKISISETNEFRLIHNIQTDPNKVPMGCLIADDQNNFYLTYYLVANHDFDEEWIIFKIGYDNLINFIDKKISFEEILKLSTPFSIFMDTSKLYYELKFKIEEGNIPKKLSPKNFKVFLDDYSANNHSYLNFNDSQHIINNLKQKLYLIHNNLNTYI